MKILTKNGDLHGTKRYDYSDGLQMLETRNWAVLMVKEGMVLRDYHSNVLRHDPKSYMA